MIDERTWCGSALRASAIAVVACAMACSAREAVLPLDVTCEQLLAAPASENECASWECEWVWVSETELFGQPAIFNTKELRLDGQRGAVVAVLGQRWRVFDGVAIRVDAVSRERLRGQLLDCRQKESTPSDFVAVPLAPQRAASEGFSLLAQLSMQEPEAIQQDEEREAERGLDLASLDETTVVAAMGTGGLRVIDVSGVANGALRELAHIPAALGDNYNDVTVVERRYAFAASKDRGLVVWDLAVPRRPVFITDGYPERTPRDGHSLLRQGDTLYVAQAPATGTGALYALDVSEPTRPREKWRFVPSPGHDVHDMSVRGDRVYVSSRRGGVYVLRQVTEGDNQRVELLHHHGLDNAHNIAFLPAVEGKDWLIVSSEQLGARLFMGEFDSGAEDPVLSLAPTTGGLLETGPAGMATQMAASPHNIECRRSVCFVAHYQLGLRVLDWSSLGEDQPEVLASYATWQPTAVNEREWLSGASGVLLTPSVVYVIDTHGGLFALRWTTPTVPLVERRQ